MNQVLTGVMEINRQVRLYEKQEGCPAGTLTTLYPFETVSTIRCKFLLNVLVSKKFFDELLESETSKVKNMCNFNVMPHTIIGVPMYVMHDQKEDFKVIRR